MVERRADNTEALGPIPSTRIDIRLHFWYPLFMNKKGLIGVFDSGFGGINVLRGIVKELPEYDYLYLGDSARTPYGTRSKDTVYEFTKQAVDFLFKIRHSNTTTISLKSS